MSLPFYLLPGCMRLTPIVEFSARFNGEKKRRNGNVVPSRSHKAREGVRLYFPEMDAVTCVPPA